MGFGADPFSHIGVGQSSALAEVRSAAEVARQAESKAAKLAPPDLLESAPFRENTLHVTDAWRKRMFPLIKELTVSDEPKLTPNRNHISRSIFCKSGDERSAEVGIDTHDWSAILYSPACQHESPSSQRQRIMRFRRREEQALTSIHEFFQSLEQEDYYK